MSAIALDHHLEITPNVRGGKPCIAGTGITVWDIVQWHVQSGTPLQEIAQTYDLPLAGIHAAMAYYYDHREEIDRAMADSDARVEQLKARTSSLLDEKRRANDHG